MADDNAGVWALALAGLGVLVLSMKKSPPLTRKDSILNPDVYPTTLQQWQHQADTYGLDGAVWIGIVPGNGAVDGQHRHGARSTIIYFPRTFNRNRPFELIFFFHGLNGYQTTDRIGSQLREMEAQDRNFIFVAPEMPWSHHTLTPGNRQGSAFAGTQEENMVTFYNNVLGILKNQFGVSIKVNKITMIGHSAGGATLRGIARSGAMDQIKPDLIVFSDAGYGYWTDQTWDNYAARDQSRWVFLVREGDKPHRYSMRFLKRFGQTPSNISMTVYPRGSWTHKRIGDSSMITSHGL